MSKVDRTGKYSHCLGKLRAFVPGEVSVLTILAIYS